MTESWEEKTERLEREYQARIDRLREELREMESQLEAKDKRVAELEASVASNKHWFALAWNNLDRIHVLERLTADLQSQLAWTPVSVGLPTEAGLYEFATKRGWVYSWRLDEDGWWQDEKEDDHYDEPVCDMQPFVIYRRIELPKDGES